MLLLVALLVMASLDALRAFMLVRVGGWLDSRLGPSVLTKSIFSQLCRDGDDTFYFADDEGDDVIYVFVAGAGTDDVIDLHNNTASGSFSDVPVNADYDGAGNVVIDLGGSDQVTLLGVQEANLHADDFSFV